MCGSSSNTKKAAADQSAWTTSMKAEADQVFGMDTRIVHDLVNTAESIWAAGPSQQGFSAAEQSAKNAAAITHAANATRFAAERAGAAGAVTPGGVGRFGGGQATGGTGVPAASEEWYQKGAILEADALNQIQQQNWEKGNENWKVAGGVLQSAPGVFNNVDAFNKNAQSGLDRNMDNAQAADAASNWWVKPVMGLAGAGLNAGMGMLTGGASLAGGSMFGKATAGQISQSFGGPSSVATTASSLPDTLG